MYVKYSLSLKIILFSNCCVIHQFQHFSSVNALHRIVLKTINIKYENYIQKIIFIDNLIWNLVYYFKNKIKSK